MKEAFLHHLWKFKKFDTQNLRTVNNEKLSIVSVGQYLELAGPDFFNAQIAIGNQRWAGNVEIHINSSDWYVHNHERDANYDNVILHVVWNHDSEIFRKDNSEIPVLELKNYIASETLNNYKSLMTPQSWINCEKDLKTIDDFTIKNWQERLFFERLERKSLLINDLLQSTNNDWEAVLFCLLAKNFGLNTSGAILFKMAQHIPFHIIRKEATENENLEALFFGSTQLLQVEKEDRYFQDLKFRYFYLLNKYNLQTQVFEPLQFFKHRPDNFPTIRLSQLASLYSNQHNLFSKIIHASTVAAVYEVFNVSVSTYWKTHFLFDKESEFKNKKLAKGFIDLIIINTIIPLQFAYGKAMGLSDTDKLVGLMNQIASEKNTIIQKFGIFGLKATNAFDSQSLLQLKNEYCNKGKCLECAIGMHLLKGN